MTRRRRRRIAAVGMMLSMPIALFCLGQFAALRVNLTPSFPLGLWRVEPLIRPAGVGDVVFICPPSTTAFAMALARGYIRRGSCAGGLSPLIKKIVAIAGAQVRIASAINIDGRPLPYSSIHRVDAADRPLTSWSGGVVPAGEVFLHSDFVGSYDSRYFGPVPAAGVLGRAVPVLTLGQ
jgi:conjugative transfer signal peptidase TraF